MKSLLLLIIIPCLFNGCTPGKFSVNEGEIKFAFPFDWPGAKKEAVENRLGGVYVGMPKSKLYEVFKEAEQKGYHKQGNEEWVTFSIQKTKVANKTVTFCLIDGKLREWLEK